jgi:general secretion pathway protein I
MLMSRESGTMLVETLVAVGLVAVILGAMFQVIQSNTAQTRMIEDRTTALLIAQSQLAAAGIATPLANGRSAGVADGFVWRVDVRGYSDAGAGAAAGALRTVTVTVSRENAADQPLATLTTLKLSQQAGT